MKKSMFMSVLMIVLAATSVLTLIFTQVKAVNTAITLVTPSTNHGKVGDVVRVVGTLNKTGGAYRVWFGSSLVVNNTNAVGNVVNSTFLVPKLPHGNYTLSLQDVTNNVNGTSWFFIDTAYHIEVRNESDKPLKSTEHIQETGLARVWVNATGAEAGKIYVANVTVRMPSPINTTYWSLVRFNATSAGEGYGVVVYPNVTAQSAQNTNFTGSYAVAFNGTLPASVFSVGLTNSTEYHRFEHVNIKAGGYRSNENVTVRVSLGSKLLQRENMTASLGGIVAADWFVPSNASIDTYTIKINSTSGFTVKNPPDIQLLTVPGFDINVTVKNRALETVRDVPVRFYENRTSVWNDLSDPNGLVTLKLEVGYYLCNASLRGRKIGERTINVTGAASLDLICNLTNLRVLVISEASVRIPEVSIRLTPENLTLVTDVNGTAVAHSLLPDVGKPYVLNASRYGVPFGVPTSIQSLLVNSNVEDWYDVTVRCPTLTLQVNAIKAASQPIVNATVKVQEAIGGIHSERKTDSTGRASFSFVFGRYLVGIYDSEGIKLNETTVDLFQNRNVSILCKLYGLSISVRVVDFLGQPIPNANVTLQREGSAMHWNLTQSNGIANFTTAGGSLQATVYLSDQTQPYVAKGVLAEESMIVEIKVEKYVSLAGLLVETSHLALVLVIALAVLLVLVMEIVRRRRFGSQKTEDLSENK